MRTFNRSASIALLAALAAVSLGRAAAPAAGENAQLRSILAAWSARQQSVHSYSFTWTGKEFGQPLVVSVPGMPPGSEPGTAPPSADTRDYRVLFSADARGRMRYDLAAFQPVSEIWNGDYDATLCTEKNPLCDIGVKHPSMGKSIQVEPWMVSFRPFDPACGGFDSTKLVLTPDVHFVDGHKCLTVQQSRSITSTAVETRELWVDATMDYIPVRMFMIYYGAVGSETDVKCVRDPRVGWMPDSWVISLFAMSQPGVVKRGWSGKITEYTFNQEIPDSKFVVPDLPPRTWVNDHRTNEHYLIRADGTKRPVGPNEFNGSNIDQLLNSDPPNSLPHPTPRRMWLIYVNIAAVLVLAAIVVARWMRQRKSTA